MTTKNTVKFFLLLVSFLFISQDIYSQNCIRVNQLGYTEKSIKTAVFGCKTDVTVNEFAICDALTNQTVYTSNKIKEYGQYGPFVKSYRLDFSKFTSKGAYYIKANGIVSPNFRISNDVYNGTADFILNYMRQQQSGYNPFLKDSCHTHDGYIIYHPTLDSTYIDVKGGWHDATDYLQYVTTSANAVFQLLFAYEQNPTAFGDKYDKDGNPKPNGIPDVLDEAKWGLDWLVKMNPEKNVMFNQLADDRDHRGFRLPNHDSASYGMGLQRPVYYCNGKPQGVYKYKNRTTGIASTAGKYASAFALGSKLLSKYYPEFSNKIKQKAIDAYNWGKENPGVCQTAPCTSPYFYEEDNWTDDMELAATQLNNITAKKEYAKDAVKYGKEEPTTPWMGADTARHYQWYPFLNLGHYYLAAEKDKSVSKSFIADLKLGLEKIYTRGKNNAFLNGVPFIWCSNNLVAAAITQAHLYFNLTKDTKYQEMEASLRDWLLGCNPWGTSMIIGLPAYGKSPSDPHSSLWTKKGYKITGGMVDGPVYGTIYRKLEGLKLTKPDEFENYQSDYVVYHNDYGDYSTNEPTTDGTASLAYYFSAMQKENNPVVNKQKNFTNYLGAIIRTDTTKKVLSISFTGHEFADGFETLKKIFDKHHIKAGFFLTGDFYRNKNYEQLIKTLKKDGHYLGSHSDKHLLYAPWEKRDSTLVTFKEFKDDLENCYKSMAKFGIQKEDAPYFLPPYEYYNQQIADWCKSIGITLINFTPGTGLNQDWTVPVPGEPYYSSDSLYKGVTNYEKKDPHGLNGFILLSHIGTDPRRTDKFYYKLDSLITELEGKGYKFVRVDKNLSK
jgi:endoglucanase